MSNKQELRQHVDVVDYNPEWASIYEAEQALLRKVVGQPFVKIEHIGSTAIPNQHAKPIIDMMVATQTLDDLDNYLPALNDIGYQLIEAGMRERFFLRRSDAKGQVFHLHIVALDTWDERKERLMRDYLLKNPEAVKAYGDLKHKLALQYADDSIEYTKAKTAFIQEIVNKARAEHNLPPIDVWNE